MWAVLFPLAKSVVLRAVESEQAKRLVVEVLKSMKKKKKDFEARYGDDAKSVMYATATKIAKKKA